MFSYSYLNTTNIPFLPTVEINQTVTDNFIRKQNFSFPAIIILAIFSGIVSLCTISGNMMVLVAFIVERNIRTASNYFIVSLAATDVLIGLFSMNLFTAYLLIGYWPLGNVLCDLWLSLDYTACLTSQYNVLFITVDRFFSVRLPVRYRNWRTNSKVKVMVAITWILPSTIFFTSIMGWRHFTGEQRRRLGECFAEFTTYPIFITVLTVCYFWVTLIVMIGLYMGIYKAAWDLHVKNKTRHKNMNSLMAMASHTMSQIGVGMTWKNKENNHDRSPSDRESSDHKAPDLVSYNSTPPMKEKRNESNAAAVKSQNSGVSKNCRFDIHSNNQKDSGKQSEPTVKTVKFIKEREISEGYTSTMASSSDRMHQRSLNSPPEEFFELKYIDDEFDSLLNSPASEEEILLASICPEFASTGTQPSVHFNLCRTPSNHTSSKGFNGISKDTAGKTTSVTTSIREVARKINAKRKQSLGIIDINSARSENRARKALRTISFILGAFVLCWTPFHILVLIKSFCDNRNKHCINDHIFNVAYWLCYLNSPINPFCYALANAQFKMAFKRVLRGELRTP